MHSKSHTCQIIDESLFVASARFASKYVTERLKDITALIYQGVQNVPRENDHPIMGPLLTSSKVNYLKTINM